MPPKPGTAVELSAYTTLRVGGPAGRFVAARTHDELIALVRDCDSAEEPALVLAGGSNVVISDGGFPGTVIHVATRGIERDGTTLRAAAGEPWDELVALTVEAGLAGMECLSGIPGSTGATPIQNVGAYGQEVSETLTRVRAYDRAAGETVDLGPADCGFAYRTSRFKRDDRFVILEVEFSLHESALGRPVQYAELARALGVELGEAAPLAATRQAVLALRRGKGMVIDPADPDSVSAGSFFTNPILDPDDVERIAERAGARPPAWPQADGRIKTSSAWLIERAGFHRGLDRGLVGISSKHTLALITRDGATARDLVALAREVAGGVRERFGVELRPEPVFVGHNW